MPDATISLSAGNLRLELSPSVGGSICAFEWTKQGERRPILRKCDSPPAHVLESACFPLVPYVNRIRDGRFSFRGREVRLHPNIETDPSPLHGQGWLNPWTVDSAGSRDAALIYRHEAAEWPWDYQARQQFVLDEGGLSVDLRCTNMSPEPMPCGLGQHPYFPCGSKTRLDTQVEVAWTIDRNVLPVEKVAAEGRYDLRDRAICSQSLDNGFGGWSGEARMGDPDWPYFLRLTAPDAAFFQVYSPPDGGIFVAEPVTHANAALNAPESEWHDLGMRILGPGESMSLTMRLDVQAG